MYIITVVQHYPIAKKTVTYETAHIAVADAIAKKHREKGRHVDIRQTPDG